MDCEINLSRLQGIADNIIKTENNYDDKSLKLHYKCEPDRRCVMNIIRYLNNLNNTDWKNYKFNQYSIRKNEQDYIITLNYVVPPLFSK